MKNIILFCFMFIISAIPVPAEKMTEVNLRFGKQDSGMRIVLEADDTTIKNANTITSAVDIKIEFPVQFTLKKQKDFPFDTAQKERLLKINLKNATDIKSYKLSAPARIVIDMKIKQLEGNQTADQNKLEQKKPVAASQATNQQTAETSQNTEKPFKLKSVVIDAGHGGYDYGIFDQNQKEKDINLNIAKDLAAILQKKGLKVFLTRKVDQPMSLSERINFGNSKTPDLFLSLHTSSGDAFAIYTASDDDTNTDAAIRLYRLNSRQNRHLEKSRSSAKSISIAIKDEFGLEVGLRELPLPLLTSIDAVSLIIEYPFPKQTPYDQKMRDRLINAVLKGISSNE